MDIVGEVLSQYGPICLHGMGILDNDLDNMCNKIDFWQNGKRVRVEYMFGYEFAGNRIEVVNGITICAGTWDEVEIFNTNEICGLLDVKRSIGISELTDVLTSFLETSLRSQLVQGCGWYSDIQLTNSSQGKSDPTEELLNASRMGMLTVYLRINFPNVDVPEITEETVSNFLQQLETDRDRVRVREQESTNLATFGQ